MGKYLHICVVVVVVVVALHCTHAAKGRMRRLILQITIHLYVVFSLLVLYL